MIKTLSRTLTASALGAFIAPLALAAATVTAPAPGGTLNEPFNGVADYAQSTLPTNWDWIPGASKNDFLIGAAWLNRYTTPLTPQGTVAYLAYNPAAPGQPYVSTGIQQTVTALIPGASYNVSFYELAEWDKNIVSGNHPYWAVGFGSDSVASQGFDSPASSAGYTNTGWQKQTITFVASSSAELLSFTSKGVFGQPNYLLISGVSITAAPVPEASTAVLSLVGLVGLGFWSRRRQANRSGS